MRLFFVVGKWFHNSPYSINKKVHINQEHSLSQHIEFVRHKCYNLFLLHRRGETLQALVTRTKTNSVTGFTFQKLIDKMGKGIFFECYIRSWKRCMHPQQWWRCHICSVELLGKRPFIWEGASNKTIYNCWSKVSKLQFRSCPPSLPQLCVFLRWFAIWPMWQLTMTESTYEISIWKTPSRHHFLFFLLYLILSGLAVEHSCQ